MKTPITLITGYLGSGKTTLLRHIIDNADRKLAVLMNEFGQIAIDSQVIKGKNIDMIELKGGCVCCSLTGEFEAALKEIREKIDPELIVIETTGVAEPDAIIGDITENIEGVRLDAVITIVDVDAMKKFPSLGYTGRVQIEMADIILLNKTDLIDDNELTKIEDTIRRINPSSNIYRTEYCRIDLDLILDMSMEHKKAGREHVHSIKESGIEHFVYSSKKKLSREKLEELVLELPKDIIRAKGFVVTDQGSFLFNMVFGRYDFEEFAAERSELVFIGKHATDHESSVIGKLRECEID